MKRLILFDIDGTLTSSRNCHLPFNRAILDTFGVAGDIRSVVPDGNTDPRIVTEIFATAGLEVVVEDGHWDRFAANLHKHYTQALLEGLIAIRAQPGALALLTALYGIEEFGRAVVTGNLEPSARLKLEAAGLHTFLSCGAYGSDSHYRADLPALARERWQLLTGEKIEAGSCIVLGDTPRDLEAARKNRMKCVLVATGRYPIEELVYEEPDACLTDLCRTAEVIDLLSSI